MNRVKDLIFSVNRFKGFIVFVAGIAAVCTGFFFRLNADEFGWVPAGGDSSQYSPDRVQVFVQLGYGLMGFGLILLLVFACWWLLSGPLRKPAASEQPRLIG